MRTRFLDGHQRHWKDVAAAKRAENMGKIPQEWRLPKEVLVEAKKRKSIAGAFIESLLDTETRTITGLENERILDFIRNGSLTALRVTAAFCKRAAYAHQLVCKSDEISLVLDLTENS